MKQINCRQDFIGQIGLEEKGRVWIVGRKRNYAVLEEAGWNVISTPEWQDNFAEVMPPEDSWKKPPHFTVHSGRLFMNPLTYPVTYDAEEAKKRYYQPPGGIYIFDPSYASLEPFWLR